MCLIRICSLEQRKLYRQQAKVIIGDRLFKLEEAGFDWNPGVHKPTFEERLDECREFRRRQGHLNIPVPTNADKRDPEAFETKELKSFCFWAQRQRDDYRRFNNGMKSSLDRKRIRALSELGFAWNFDNRGVPGNEPVLEAKKSRRRSEVSFEERVNQLRELREKYGDCNSLTTLKEAGYSETSALYQWMKNQRKSWKAFKKGLWTSLTAERIRLLERIDFDFEPRKHYAPYGSRLMKVAGQDFDEVPAQLDASDQDGDEEEVEHEIDDLEHAQEYQL
jgi:Helicase associated domain